MILKRLICAVVLFAFSILLPLASFASLFQEVTVQAASEIGEGRSRFADHGPRRP